MTDGKYDKLEVHELSIIDKDGKQVAVIAPADGGAGFWIYSPSGQMVAIFATQENIGIGLFGKESDEHMPIVLTLDEADGPVIQVKVGSKILEINSRDLERLDKLGLGSTAKLPMRRTE